MGLASRPERRPRARAVALVVATLAALAFALAVPSLAEGASRTFPYRRLWARVRFALSIAEALAEEPSAARSDARQQVLLDALGAFTAELPAAVPDGPLADRLGLFQAFDALAAELDEEHLSGLPELAALGERALALADRLALDLPADAPAPTRARIARARVDWRLRRRWTVPVGDLETTTRTIRECAAILAEPAGRTAYADGGEVARRRLSAWTDAALGSPAWSLAPGDGLRAAERQDLLATLFDGGPSAAGVEALVERLSAGLVELIRAPETDPRGPRARVLTFLEARALIGTLTENLDRTSPSPLSRERFLELCSAFDDFPDVALATADPNEWSAIAPEGWSRRLRAAREDRAWLDVPELLPGDVQASLLDAEGRAYPIEPLIVDAPGRWPTLPGAALLLRLGSAERGVPFAVHPSAASGTLELPPALPLGVVLFVGPSAEESRARELVALEAEAWTRERLVAWVMELTPAYITPPTDSGATIWEPVYAFLVDFLEDPAGVDLRKHEGRQRALALLTRRDETAVLSGATAERLLGLLAEFRATRLPPRALCDWIEPWVGRTFDWTQLDTGVRHLCSDEPVDPDAAYILRESYHLVLP